MACGLLVTVNRPKSLTFKEIGLASLAMNSVIFAMDLALGANYGYLTRVPIAFFDFVPVPLVFLIMTILIAIALYLVEILKKKFGTFAV